jgi:hypothetical protein
MIGCRRVLPNGPRSLFADAQPRLADGGGVSRCCVAGRGWSAAVSEAFRGVVGVARRGAHRVHPGEQGSAACRSAETFVVATRATRSRGFAGGERFRSVTGSVVSLEITRSDAAACAKWSGGASVDSSATQRFGRQVDRQRHGRDTGEWGWVDDCSDGAVQCSQRGPLAGMPRAECIHGGVLACPNRAVVRPRHRRRRRVVLMRRADRWSNG